jgi:hypothetical protein
MSTPLMIRAQPRNDCGETPNLLFQAAGRSCRGQNLWVIVTLLFCSLVSVIARAGSTVAVNWMLVSLWEGGEAKRMTLAKLPGAMFPIGHVWPGPGTEFSQRNGWEPGTQAPLSKNEPPGHGLEPLNVSWVPPV